MPADSLEEVSVISEVSNRVSLLSDFSVMPFKSVNKDHMVQTLTALEYLKALPEFGEETISDRRVYIPVCKRRKRLVIFDLDETLVHCMGTQEECAGKQVDRWVELKFPGEEKVLAGINVKPFAQACLRRLCAIY